MSTRHQSREGRRKKTCPFKELVKPIYCVLQFNAIGSKGGFDLLSLEQKQEKRLLQTKKSKIAVPSKGQIVEPVYSKEHRERVRQVEENGGFR